MKLKKLQKKKATMNLDGYELLDDNGTYQSIYIPPTSKCFKVGWSQYLDDRSKHDCTIAWWTGLAGHNNPVAKRAGREHHEDSLNDHAVMITTLEIFPRTNEWGDVSP